MARRVSDATKGGGTGVAAGARRPRVVVVGGGFGGIAAARALAREPVDVTLVDRTNHHLFQPLLYQVATAGLSAPAIAAPIRHVLRRQRNALVLLGEVSRVDVAARRLVLADGDAIPYDALILAPGSTHGYFGHDDWAPHAPGLKTLADALGIRNRVLLAFERAEREADPVARRSWLTFVVVGGGPTGVELAGTLAEVARKTLRDEFRRFDPGDSRIVLAEAGPRILPAFPESLSASAHRELVRLGVEVRLHSPVSAVDAGGATIDDLRIDARTVLWGAGVVASPLGRDLGAPLDRSGRVVAKQDLSVPGHPEVFVVGDLAHVGEGERVVPGVAQAAKQMGRHAARNVARRLRGEPTRPFRYRDYATLAAIGRNAAVAVVGKVWLTGVVGWAFWAFIHLFFLIGFRNRVVVMLDWASSYFTFERHARIALPDPDPRVGRFTLAEPVPVRPPGAREGVRPSP